MVHLIRQAGNRAYRYCCNAYCQLKLDTADWLFMCFMVEGWCYADVSLPFSLHWVASCQDVTGLVAKHLDKQSIQVDQLH